MKNLVQKKEDMRKSPFRGTNIKTEDDFEKWWTEGRFQR